MIPFRNLGNQIEHLPLANGTKQLDVICVSPHQGHGGARRPSAVHVDLGLIGTAPRLLG